jgi:hydrogenase nickel incorporation protein HypA/HybF
MSWWGTCVAVQPSHVHELGIAELVAGIAREQAGDRRVRSVRMRIGHLRRLAPDTLRFAFDLVIRETPLEGAQIEIESVPVAALCERCEVESPQGEFPLECPHCGSRELEIVRGDELRVESLDLYPEPVLRVADAEHGLPQCQANVGCFGPAVERNVPTRPSISGVCIAGESRPPTITGIYGPMIRRLRGVTNRIVHRERHWMHSRPELTTGRALDRPESCVAGPGCWPLRASALSRKIRVMRSPPEGAVTTAGGGNDSRRRWR